MSPNPNRGTTYGPLPSPTDLRRMVRDHLGRRALSALARNTRARNKALQDRKTFARWSRKVRRNTAAILDLTGLSDHPLNTRLVSRHEYSHHVTENVIFESVSGWEVNGSVFIPHDPLYAPPYPAVVVPCGHSTKTGDNYQLVCQVFARAGFIAITFDPPGQGTEKNPGNDHFLDGARCYAVGHNSQRYFVADALRALDYLETRKDVNREIGFAITGVSGGGHTSIWTALLDPRIRLSAPVCCATPLAEHPVLDAYATCAEGLPIGRFTHPLDDVEQMMALAPTPQLFMAGAADEVMTSAMSQQLADEVTAAYAQTGTPHHFAFRLEPSGHAYTPDMARTFVRFADQHWLQTPTRPHSTAFDADPDMMPAEHLLCRPAPTPNMFTISSAEAARLRTVRPKLDSPRALHDAVAAVLPGVDQVRVREVRRGNRQTAWCADVEELLLKPEPGIWLPATALWPLRPGPSPLVVMFDDRGRWASLQQSGWLAQVSRFLDREAAQAPVVMSVDLRGWGDSRPAPTAYDLAGWSGPDRWPTYMANALNDGLLGQRVRDAVASVRWLIEQPNVDAGRLMIAGHGMGSIVALMAAAALPPVTGVVCMEGPLSIESAVAAEHPGWPLDIFHPAILRHLDVPDLIAALPNVLCVNTRDGSGKVIASSATPVNPVDWVFSG